VRENTGVPQFLYVNRNSATSTTPPKRRIRWCFAAVYPFFPVFFLVPGLLPGLFHPFTNSSLPEEREGLLLSCSTGSAYSFGTFFFSSLAKSPFYSLRCLHESSNVLTPYSLMKSLDPFTRCGSLRSQSQRFFFIFIYSHLRSSFFSKSFTTRSPWRSAAPFESFFLFHLSIL